MIEAGKKYIDLRGFGMSSVRFICGTQDIHKELERKISEFLGTEDTILYAACFDANGGVFEPLFGEEDAIISDTLNHASIIDGVRLCKAKRFRYEHNNMADLESKLKEAAEMYAGCVSGAIQKNAYLELISVNGFKNIIVQKEKSILLPDDILANYFTAGEIESFRNSDAGIYSITVYAEKPLEETKACCDSNCCN